MAQLDNIMQLDVLLPSQHFGPRRRQAPEHRLMMAVLRDAIHCLEKCRFAENVNARRTLRETQWWFLCGETDWPYSFECICAVLDLDADAVRQGLRLMPPNQPVLVSRAPVHAACESRNDSKEDESCGKSRRDRAT